MRYLTYPERQEWTPLKRGDVVIGKDLTRGRDVVFLLLEPSSALYNERGTQDGWECLVLHSDAPGLRPGTLATPATDFLEQGERL